MEFFPKLAAPSVEQHPTGFGVGVATPRLSWRFLTPNTPVQEWAQIAYEVEISRNNSNDTYHVDSAASVLVPWPGEPLKSRDCAQVRVRAFGKSSGIAQSQPTDWSPWTQVKCALLSRADWSAVPIASPVSELQDGPLRPVRFRKDFDLDQEDVEHAWLYITSLGVYRAFVNGHEVGDQCMAPGWTSYRHRLNYQVYDVAPLLAKGSNVIAVEVAEGWYATRLGFRGGERRIYGDRLAALAQLEIYNRDNSQFIIPTDSTWGCAPSAIVRSEIYDGEVYDARDENVSWNTPSPEADTTSWVPVEELPFPSAQLVAPDAPPVRVTEEVQPVDVLRSPSGKTILDFGQNLVGRIRINAVTKPSGARLVLRHAEVLEHGELGMRPLRYAKCTDEIIFAGNEVTNWSPHYTFHGFRYVQVDGWGDEDADLLESLTALVLHTDMARTGWFECSHPMVNKLHENALWSMRGNFLSIPTDCPQRDERLGWTGDIQIFTPSASFLYNTAGMLGDWLKDVAAEQLLDRDGCVPPFVVPNVISEALWPHLPQAIWDDVVVLTPWDLYSSYGDIDLLRRQYPSMLAWIDRGIRRGPDGLWDPTLWQLGDWLDPTAPPIEPGDARTNGTLVADTYLVHVTSTMVKICDVLGHQADAARYREDARRLKAQFQQKYIAPSGLLVGDTQTALSLAIMFDLQETPEQLEVAGNRLVDLVRLAKFRVATGFAGTPIITHALTKTGHHQVAYRMLLEKNRPSWMYPITMGATTMWERWDSMLPDGSINPGEMTSFNHYALGSIVNWLHSTVAGVRPISPGWKEIRVEPIPGGTIDSASVVYETPYGRLECRWKVLVANDRFEMELVVPVNSTALVVLPSDRQQCAGSGSGVRVGSGLHRFEFQWEARDYQRGWPPQAIIPIMRKPGPDSIA
ncbi:unnamed protein product [Penicillium olsonii]|uniref:alpha-L-rhamnosidase n=1 Tax=Penicillium olsonii TaxID=99116 RepID=A0A9W4MNS1_PENOL|nr:unnamed protein product [Penicillium olsonii]